MIISISNKNEFEFAPTIGGNRDVDVDSQFKIVVKKIDTTLTVSKWARITDDGTILDLAKKLKEHIVRIENAPTLKIDDVERALTVQDLLGGNISELFPIIEELSIFISTLEEVDQSEAIKK